MTRRSGSTSSDILQTKLRSLLNTSAENRESAPLRDVDLLKKFKTNSPSNYDRNKYMSPKKIHQEVRVRVMFSKFYSTLI